MKIYFVEVTTYANTNSLGRDVGRYASKFDHCLVTEDGWKFIMAHLKECIYYCKLANPRVRKEFVLVESNFDYLHSHYCSYHPVDDDYNCALTINTKVVKNVDHQLSNILYR